jgi:hypothetical protein
MLYGKVSVREIGRSSKSRIMECARPMNLRTIINIARQTPPRASREDVLPFMTIIAERNEHMADQIGRRDEMSKATTHHRLGWSYEAPSPFTLVDQGDCKSQKSSNSFEMHALLS